VAKIFVVDCKLNKLNREARTVVKANTAEKAKDYAIKQFQNNGYYNFQIISVKEATNT
jgi:hypothetical protein